MGTSMSDTIEKAVEQVTTAEAIQSFDDSFMKVANAFINFLRESNEQKEPDIDAPLRFDVAAVQPGAGFKVLIATLLNGELNLEYRPVLSWVLKNVHFSCGDELRQVPLVYSDSLDGAVALTDFVANIHEPHVHRVLQPGINSLDEGELKEIKDDLLREQQIRNKEIREENERRAVVQFNR